MQVRVVAFSEKLTRKSDVYNLTGVLMGAHLFRIKIYLERYAYEKKDNFHCFCSNYNDFYSWYFGIGTYIRNTIL